MNIRPLTVLVVESAGESGYSLFQCFSQLATTRDGIKVSAFSGADTPAETFIIKEQTPLPSSSTDPAKTFFSPRI